MEIQGSGLKISKSIGSYDIHITGGLIAIPTDGGLIVVPGAGSDTKGVGFRNLNALRKSLSVSPVKIFGLNEIGPPDHLQQRVWKPLNSNGSLRPLQADIWGFIHANALHAGKDRIASLARNVSFSFRAAGIRLRDASVQFHLQLKQALKDGHVSEERFSNIHLYELYLAFHSVASELGSARDYLAALLAVHHGAPSKVDSLARFADWIGKSAQRSLHADPIIAGIRSALEASGADPWLARLTELRNLFLHREPIQRSARFLTLQEFSIGTAPMHYLTLFTESDGRQRDAMHEFVHLHDQLSVLAAEIAALPSFDATVPRITLGSPDAEQRGKQ